MKDEKDETGDGTDAAPEEEGSIVEEGMIPELVEIRSNTIRTDLGEDHLSFEDPAFGGIRHFLREDKGYKEVTKNNAPVLPHNPKPRTYTAENTQSFISFLGKHGKAAEGIIFSKGFNVQAYLNEESRDEVVKFKLMTSLELISILGADGSEKTFKQKEFARIVEAFPDVFGGREELLANITKVKIDTNTQFESNIDPNNIKLYYEETNGKQEASIPKRLKLTLPYFEGSDNIIKIDIDIDIHKPSADNGDLTFTLSDFKAGKTERDAIKAEVDKLKAELTDWLFIAGEAN